MKHVQKLRSCQAPCFENLAGNSTPQQKGGEHYVSNVFKKIAFFKAISLFWYIWTY